MGLSASLTALGVLTLVLLVWVVAVAGRALRELWMAADAQRAIDGAATLVEGGTLVTGITETDGDGPAVRVCLTEDGREWRHKGRWHHEWRESGRNVQARPFHVVTDKKERVRVEPPGEVFLVDEMKVSAQLHALSRERTAELTHGERVAVSGRLRRARGAGGAYRGGEGGWVLDPPARGPMLVATQPLAAHHRKWASFFVVAAVAPAALLLLTHVVAYYGVYRFALWGRPVVATVVDHEVYTTHDRHGTHTHRQIRIDARGAEGWFEVTREGYERAGIGARVAAIETPDHALSLGGEPGFDAGLLVVPLVLVPAASMLTWLFHRSRRAWWEQKKVVTAGSGRLTT